MAAPVSSNRRHADIAAVNPDVAWSSRVRVTRQAPTAVVLLALIASLIALAVVEPKSARLLALGGVAVFTILLIEVLLPHRVEALPDAVRFRSGVHVTTVKWADVDGVLLRTSKWLGFSTAEIVFDRHGQDDLVIPHFRLAMTSRGRRAGAVQVEENLRFFYDDWRRRET